MKKLTIGSIVTPGKYLDPEGFDICAAAEGFVLYKATKKHEAVIVFNAGTITAKSDDDFWVDPPPSHILETVTRFRKLIPEPPCDGWIERDGRWVFPR